ncbi:hypothetical protein HNQ71_006748 [Mesorhizobium sangaii]|uniref:Uncharacterized protein n=1 Tax=Mesorhizobium sangaii TaxID=505389 RepID=A0A841PV40_9HYPH|nr:hypothetical protein [Mesorhizobium sangaii]
MKTHLHDGSNGTNGKLEAWRYSVSAIAIKFAIREIVIRLRRRDWFESQGRQNRRAHCRPPGRFSQDAADAFNRDGTKHGNAAPFMRNDDTPQLLPTGVAVFPGWQSGQSCRQGAQGRYPGVAHRRRHA